MRKIIRKADHFWDRFWFPETPLVRLALFRIILVVFQLSWLGDSLHMHLQFIAIQPGFIEPMFLIELATSLVPVDIFRTEWFLSGIYLFWILSGITATVGICTRISVLLFALLNLVLVAHRFSYGEFHHPEGIYAIVLFVLAFSPCGERLSLDACLVKSTKEYSSLAAWPMKLAQVLLAVAYLFAAFCKLKNGGLQWMNGYTLQNILLTDGLRWEKPLGLWLAQQHILCIFLSAGALCLEFFFWTAVLFPRIAPMFLFGGACLHSGIYLTQNAAFPEFVILYTSFINLEKLPRLKEFCFFQWISKSPLPSP